MTKKIKLMFCEIHNAFNKITSYSKNSQDYTQEVKKFIERIGYQQFDYIQRNINKQTKLFDREYAVYKLNYTTLQIEFISLVTNYDPTEYHTTLDTTDQYLLLNALSPQTLCNYILDNQQTRFIFFPLNYMTESKDSGHIASLVFDNQTKKVYMADSNGKSTYFDQLLGQPMNQYIEYMLSNYIKDINNLGLSYQYVFIDEWNAKNLHMNKHFKNSYVGVGHCLILSLMISHVMTQFAIIPKDAFELLAQLEDEELLFLIKEYGLGLYNMLRNKQ
ncbi:hypothetical protein Klosneuvirus_2_228 [Klosneuvirus KNV1]|uniref:Uncharacterized protein n=1 Tax=Klosneuvirus KNV1 TaxID=1977640 RepID=A0A1V0SJ86_9VIRU|nr:hypothetical protein Klosneuvirus_2_228 [Klosneuvirus KNV1]